MELKVSIVLKIAWQSLVAGVGSPLLRHTVSPMQAWLLDYNGQYDAIPKTVHAHTSPKVLAIFV